MLGVVVMHHKGSGGDDDLKVGSSEAKMAACLVTVDRDCCPFNRGSLISYYCVSVAPILPAQLLSYSLHDDDINFSTIFAE